MAIPAHPDDASLTRTLSRRVSEESIRTELCEGPISDDHGTSETASADPHIESEAPLGSLGNEVSAVTSDRAELIERLKRGESPTWVPSRHFESLFQQSRPSTPRSPRPPSAGSQNLLPAADISPTFSHPKSPEDSERRFRGGLDIERPRSALHRGDFSPRDFSPRDFAPKDFAPKENGCTLQETLQKMLGSGDQATAEDGLIGGDGGAAFALGTSQWDMGLAAASHPLGIASAAMMPTEPGANLTPFSAASSFTASFVYKAAPTSPLVQSELSEDLMVASEAEEEENHVRSSARRYTMNWAASLAPSVSPTTTLGSESRVPSQTRRDGSVPYRAHQPRRSTSGIGTSAPGSTPQTPTFARSRRPSCGSDMSPLQHASMVGSYEESILRGRMSTTPSKPLDFMAQIGVLGLGKCRSGLRCPSHVTLPFHAVFYHYPNTGHGRTRVDDGPSPYVGSIDLENGLPSQDEDTRPKRKLQARNVGKKNGGEGAGPGPPGDSDMDKRRRAKRSAASPKAPSGGSYRIPEKGQVQIVIKNQNKTAVKLFLVPYDLAGMEPGTKTFVRQRSYSAGPVVDSTDPAAPSIPTTPCSPSLAPLLGSNSQAARPERRILRYLVHLHICCPSRGRFYLYKDIRVVFANRVPDGKECLRNETTSPVPQFTPYKPIRVNHPPTSASGGPASSLAADRACLGRNSGFSLGQAGQAALDVMDGVASRPAVHHHNSSSLFEGLGTGDKGPIDPMPGLRSRVDSDMSSPGSPGSPGSQAQADLDGLEAGIGDINGRHGSRLENIYQKLNASDFCAVGGIPGQGTEGLLTQRLKSLGVRTPGRTTTGSEHGSPAFG